MNAFGWSGLLACVTSAAFGLLVFIKSPNRRLKTVWGLFSLTASVWGLGVLMISFSSTHDEGLARWRFVYAFGVIWMPALFYHFTCIFCELHRPRSVVAHYIIASIFFLLSPTPFLFRGARLTFDSFYYSIPGKIFPVFFSWWLAFVIYSHWEMVKRMKTAGPIQRNQIRYFFLATALGYVGGSTAYLPQFNIDIYPYGNFTVFLYPLIMSYAILKYRLMDVRLLIRRASLLMGVYIVLLLSVAPLLLFLHRKAVSSFSISWAILGIEVFILGAALSLGPFLYAYLIRHNFWLKGHLTTGLTHELKSPLSNIQGAIEIILDELKNPRINKDKGIEYAEMIQKNAVRLENYVKDLLNISKIQEGEISVQKSSLDLSQIIQTVMEGYRPLADSKSLQLNYKFDKDLPEVYADLEKIQQVISNLFSNAIKFSERGVITISAERINGEIQCCVTDQGCGISEKNLNHVFHRFFQENPNAKGSGIGLTIAKAWVEAHGGRIWAESEGEGKGTRVTFTLPNL